MSPHQLLALVKGLANESSAEDQITGLLLVDEGSPKECLKVEVQNTRTKKRRSYKYENGRQYIMRRV